MLSVNQLIGFGAGGGIGPHRYWRIHTVSNPGHSYLGYHNIEMRGVSGGPDLTGSGTDINGGGTVGAATSACFDGNCDSVGYLYAISYPTGAWIGYDFGSPVLISEVFLSEWGLAGHTSLSIQYSDNGADWAEAKLFSSISWSTSPDPVCSKTYSWAILTL